MELISVIVTYFNKKKFIKQTFDSILAQSYKNFEVIFIYDQENLEEYNYIQNLVNSDSRFKFFNNKNNYGSSFSKNLGLSFATGEYLCFLDADDLWEPNKLEFQYNHIKKNKILFSHTSYKIIDENNNLIGNMKVQDKLTYGNLMNSCDVGLSTVMIHSSLKNIILFPPLKTKEDYVVWLGISKDFDLIGIDKSLVLWRKSKNSLSSSVIQRLKDGFLVYYRYENKNFFVSLIRLFLLSFFSLVKKIKISLNNN
jgi:teichuronic acid biosynthesis glycosyltransferase TuaG